MAVRNIGTRQGKIAIMCQKEPGVQWLAWRVRPIFALHRPVAGCGLDENRHDPLIVRVWSACVPVAVLPTWTKFSGLRHCGPLMVLSQQTRHQLH